MHTLTTITPILKTLYIPGIEKYVHSEDFFTNELERREQIEQVGRTFEVKVQTGFSHGIGMGALTDTLPTAGETQFKNYTGTPKTLRGRIRLNLGVVDMVKNDPHATLDLVAAEMTGIREGIKCYNEVQNIGNAGLTPLCCVGAAAAVNEVVTVTVDDGGGVGMCGTKYPTKFFLPGMFLDILAANFAVVDPSMLSLKITDVPDQTSFTITCVDAPAAAALAALLADGQTIFYQDGYNAERFGLMALFGSTTNTVFANRALAINSYLRPYVARVSAAGLVQSLAPTGVPTANWSTLNVHEVMSFLKMTRHADESSLYLFCDEGVQAEYIQKKKSENGYFKEDVKIDGWPYKVVEAEGRPMLCPRYMPSNAICFVSMDKMKKYLNRKIDFRDDLSGQIWSKVANLDEVEAYLIGHEELGSENFQQNAWLGDLKGAYEA